MQTIPIIVGPTSTGKTKLAIALSKAFDYDIISVDSRQMFIGMDIGTGKVPLNTAISVEKGQEKWRLDGINVWGYDLVTPDVYFSAYDFASWALKKLEQLLKQGKKVMLVGGSGFFVDMLVGAVKPGEFKANLNLRNKLEKLSITELQEILMSLNKEVLEKLDKNNPARLIRAIELLDSTSISSTPLPYLKDISYSYFGLTSSRENLYSRSDTWVDTIWMNGLELETKELLKHGYLATRAMNGLIYKSVIDYIDQKLSYEEAVQRCKFDIHAYIRRQQTYFKRNPAISWYDIADEDFAREITNRVQSL